MVIAYEYPHIYAMMVIQRKNIASSLAVEGIEKIAMGLGPLAGRADDLQSGSSLLKMLNSLGRCQDLQVVLFWYAIFIQDLVTSNEIIHLVSQRIS
jgi:hypothetical protein